MNRMGKDSSLMLDKSDPSDAIMTPKRKKKKRKRRRRDELLEIPGVKKIALTELAQKIIGCTVGEDITSENPWKYVKKELIQDNLELHEESSEFLPIKSEIVRCPTAEILIGYIADEARDGEDEFYICVTKEATDSVNAIIERIKEEQEKRLHRALEREIRIWESLGTEEELYEELARNNRPLIEVEVESKYPIFPNKVEFRMVPAEKRRDGYMELKSTDDSIVNVFKRRIDRYIQAAPEFVCTEAQTTCTYPTNIATQYLYDIGDVTQMLKQREGDILNYAQENYEDLSDTLRVNGAIDLYFNDFESLIHNESTTEKRSASKDFVEYMSFMEVNLCKEKMVADADWHRMWTGTVAVTYVDMAWNVFYYGPSKYDEVYQAVHGTNPVLIWSFLDVLKPKLILETPREINCLSFCKFDENILIGGCRNGQMVIWDLRNKLQKVEEREVLTSAQHKYRIKMHGLMGWMMNVHNISVVRPAAVSDLRYSHRSSITGISWVHPLYEFNNIGNLHKLEDPETTRSMQLITSSKDGTVLIWDLKKKPVVDPGGYRPKKLKRLKQRPAALEVDVSPYRVLHLNLKPIYKISIFKPKSKNKLMPITSCTSTFCSTLNYKEANPDPKRKFHLKDRITYKPVIDEDVGNTITSTLQLGTAEGEYAEVYWEGQDFDSGEVVNSEPGKFSCHAKFHDGPVISVSTSKCSNVNLTVGGKIFALWRKDLPGRPILWRRSRQIFTKGEWNLFQPFKVVLHNTVGLVQKWILPVNSKAPIQEQVVSNNPLTSAGIHPYQIQKNIYGIGDQQGTYRLFHFPQSSISTCGDLINTFNDFINREVERKTLFFKWQSDFNKKNEKFLKMRQEEEEKAEQSKLKEVKEEIVIDKQPKKPENFIERIKEQRHAAEEARIKAMIINKKQLDTKELEKRRKPLQKLDEENERKKRKQKQRLKEGEHIFEETVASLFPDVIKEKPIPPPDPYAGGESQDEREGCYASYVQLVDTAKGFILDHPFRYEFDFRNLLLQSRIKQFKHRSGAHPHRLRCQAEKIHLKEFGSVTTIPREEAEDGAAEAEGEGEEGIQEVM